jgi:UDP-N-acetylglucosamine 3-dehydrogenase
MLRLAILGAGFMGSTHARAAHALPGVEVAAIFAPSPERGRPLAEELGTRWTDDLPALLADPAIDAVDVCLPTPQHRAPTEAALDAGKHVLLEKPIAPTLADADALVARAAASDRVVMVAHVLRFWPEYVEMQRRVAAGEIGPLRSGFASRRQPFPAWSALFARADLTGGAVVDMMIHDLDALNWLFGPPQAVTARGARNPRSGGYDQVQILIDYAGGASALVDGGMMMPESYPFSSRLELLGDSGALEYQFRAGGRSVEMGAGLNDLTFFPDGDEPIRLSPEQADPYAAEVAYFVECAQTNQPATRATPEDARRALRAALAARESLERGGIPIPLAD